MEKGEFETIQKSVNGINVESFVDEVSDKLELAVDVVKNLGDIEYFEKNTKSTGQTTTKLGFTYNIQPNIVKFDENRYIHTKGNDVVVVMYNNKNIMDGDIRKHKELYVDYHDVQSPDVLGFCEYKDKHFLILHNRHPLKGATNERKYMGLIINPYAQIDDIKKDSSKEIGDVISNK